MKNTKVALPYMATTTTYLYEQFVDFDVYAARRGKFENAEN
jgi:hypothetical protein